MDGGPSPSCVLPAGAAKGGLSAHAEASASEEGRALFVSSLSPDALEEEDEAAPGAEGEMMLPGS